MILKNYSYKDMINDETVSDDIKVIEADPERYEASWRIGDGVLKSKSFDSSGLF